MMLTLLKNSYSAVIASVVFFTRNFWCVKNVLPFTIARHREFRIEPMSKKNLCAAVNLYASLNGGRRIGLHKVVLLWLVGSRLGLVAYDIEKNEMVGITFYYFNTRDRKDGTVHEGYIGLCPATRSIGLGTFVRRHALMNFALSGLTGVSSRISVGNIASLKGNEKLGFIPVETYFDPSMSEIRHYLICDLKKFIKSIGKSEGIFQR